MDKTRLTPVFAWSTAIFTLAATGLWSGAEAQVAPATNSTSRAGLVASDAGQQAERGTTGRLKVTPPDGWQEVVGNDDVFALRYTQSDEENAPTLALAGDFGEFGEARAGLSLLIGDIQTGTPGFRVKATTDIDVPGATSAVRLDFTYGTEDTNGVFEAVWIVAADKNTHQSIALALSGSQLDPALLQQVQSSLVMLPAAGSAPEEEKLVPAQLGTTDEGASGAAPEAGQVLATGRYQNGEIIAEVDGLVRDGEKLTVKMALRPAQQGQRVGVTVIYSGLGGTTYEDVYLIAGDKKYMLMRDSNGNALAPQSLAVSGSGAMIGTWYGMFPAPPAGQDITLYLPGMEPIGPFKTPAE